MEANDRTNKRIVRLAMGLGALVLIIVIGIGAVVVALALDMGKVIEEVKGVGTETRRQAIVNEIEVLEHRKRNETCVVEYLKQIAQARDANHPLSQIPQCEADSIPEIEEHLDEARQKLKEVGGGKKTN